MSSTWHISSSRFGRIPPNCAGSSFENTFRHAVRCACRQRAGRVVSPRLGRPRLLKFHVARRRPFSFGQTRHEGCEDFRASVQLSGCSAFR
jgi:hypothetical protein